MILSCKAMYCYRKDLPSTSTTSRMSVKYIQLEVVSSPVEKSFKRGRHSVFFTMANPMEDEDFVEETSCDLTKPRIVPYEKYFDGNLIRRN